MANIDVQITSIQAAARGEEVRDSIVSALQAFNGELEGYTSRLNRLQSEYDALNTDEETQY